MKKKDRMKTLGKDVKTDSKYSGRNRGLIRILKWWYMLIINLYKKLEAVMLLKKNKINL